MSLFQHIKLSRNQSGIAHLGLVLVIVAVVGVIGLASYSVLHKPNSHSLEQKVVAEDLTQQLDGKNLFKSDADKAKFQNLLEGTDLEGVKSADDLLAKNPKLKNLLNLDGTNSDGELNSEAFKSIVNQAVAGGKLKTSSIDTDELTQKFEEGSGNSKPNLGGTVTTPEPDTSSSNSSNSDSSDSSSSGSSSDSSDSGSSSDSGDSDNSSSDSSSGSSDSSTSSGGSTPKVDCKALKRVQKENGCGPCDPSSLFMENTSTSGWNKCVSVCPNGRVPGTNTCQRSGAPSVNTSKDKCEKELGRIYDSGKGTCLRQCNYGKYLTDYASGSAFDKCVGQEKDCPKHGWAIKPGFCAPENSKKPKSNNGGNVGNLSCSAAEKAGIVSGKYTCAKSTDKYTACRHVTGDNSKPGGNSPSQDLYLPKFRFKSSKDGKTYSFDLCLDNSKNGGHKVISDDFKCTDAIDNYLRTKGYLCPSNNSCAGLGKNTITVNNYSFTTGGKVYKTRVCKLATKSNTSEVSCNQFLNYVNTYYYQCPTSSSKDPYKACPEKKANAGFYLVSRSLITGKIAAGGKTVIAKNVCKYTYKGNNPDTGPKEKAGCEGYLKRVWRDNKCQKDCLPKYEYWRTISSGTYKGWAQCRLKTDDVASVTKSFCDGIGRTWARDSKGNGRCGDCKSGYKVTDKKSHNWKICKKEEEKKVQNKTVSCPEYKKKADKNVKCAYLKDLKGDGTTSKKYTCDGTRPSAGKGKTKSKTVGNIRYTTKTAC